MVRRIIEQETTDITEIEWNLIEQALSKSRYSSVTGILRECKNKPTPANEALPRDIVNAGEQSINEALKKKRCRFRLKRIGSYSGREDRHTRLLAFVRDSPYLPDPLPWWWNLKRYEHLREKHMT